MPGGSSAKLAEPAFHGRDTPSTALMDMCVHCGFCLPTCPTYALWGEEMDSPRGRIYLMRGATEGRIGWSDDLVRHFDACLGCVSCVTACPSGVRYGPLIEHTRAQIERHYARPLADRAFRALVFRVVPYPAIMRWLLAPLALARGLVRAISRSSLAARLPRRLGALLALAPDVSWTSLQDVPPVNTPGTAPVRRKVALLTGCVQRLVFSRVHRATIRVLAAEGCDVVAPAGQGCCGALSRHAGRLDEARAFARSLIEVFERSGAETIVVNAAGCGSSMKEYGELLADDPVWADRARAFGRRVQDVTELVAELGEPRAPRHPIRARVAYHDACHLAHAQGIRAEPRRALATIPDLEVVELDEAEICCGSAGIYNLVQPRAASDLGRRKADRIQAVQPDAVATANPGCALQIAAACRGSRTAPPVLHPIELVDASIRRVDPLGRETG